MGSGDVVANRSGGAAGARRVNDQAPADWSESAAPSSVLLSSADEIARAMLGLLAEIEASLRGSQKAVLARDGEALEKRTREQVRLHRALELLLWPRAWPGTVVERDALSGSPPRSVPRFVAECAPFLAAELLAAERRVLQGTRLPISEAPLDEEAAKMAQYQQAYDASIQVITFIDDTMDAVIHLSKLNT
jgi:hypothetical protein